MNTYHKIQGLYKRYTEGDKKGKFIIGLYSKPEFKLLKDIQWEWTEKIDGTNIRVCWYPNDTIEEIEFKGKTDKSDLPKNLLIKLQEIFDISKFKELFPRGLNSSDICLYGEGYGYKIQSGGKYFPENPKEVGFILFDIKIGNTWLKREDVEKIANQLGIKTVPIVGYGTIDEAIKEAKGFISKFGMFKAEGLVIRPKVELNDRRGHRIITKIKYKDFKEE